MDEDKVIELSNSENSAIFSDRKTLFASDNNSSEAKQECLNAGEPVCSEMEVNFSIKLLVTDLVSGAIIGKSGNTIFILQQTSGAKVHISNRNELYPGTNERVCHITGSIENMMRVLKFIIDKIHDVSARDNYNTENVQCKLTLIVPESAAAVIIGRKGHNVQNIRKQSGCFVHLSNKNQIINLERLINVTGEKDGIIIACRMLLSKIVEDSQSEIGVNISSTKQLLPIANVSFATEQNVSSSSTSLFAASSTAENVLDYNKEIYLSLILGAQWPNSVAPGHILGQIRANMLNTGYTEANISEVCAALGVLSKHGVVSMGVNGPRINGAQTAIDRCLDIPMLNQQTSPPSTAIGNNMIDNTVNQVCRQAQLEAATTFTSSSNVSHTNGSNANAVGAYLDDSPCYQQDNSECTAPNVFSQVSDPAATLTTTNNEPHTKDGNTKAADSCLDDAIFHQQDNSECTAPDNIANRSKDSCINCSI